MAGSKVDNVNEVADSSAVRSVVVVSPDLQLLLSSNRHLRHKRQQVVRNAGRVFSDEAAFMRANRIEISQDTDPPGGVGFVEILQHFLEEELCSTIWICRSERMSLVERKIGRHSIHGRR